MVDNSDWAIAESYPQYIIVPDAIPVKVICSNMAPSRKDDRFPVTTYRHHSNGCVLLLASFAVNYAEESDIDEEFVTAVLDIPITPKYVSVASVAV
jgi:hypothetical protein